MKLIEKIVNYAEDELRGSECYAKSSLEYKGEYPTLAKAYYDLSIQEMTHFDTLHDQVTRVIEQYKLDEGDPPDDMVAIYKYLHGKYVDWASKIKLLQAQYRG